MPDGDGNPDERDRPIGNGRATMPTTVVTKMASSRHARRSTASGRGNAQSEHADAHDQRQPAGPRRGCHFGSGGRTREMGGTSPRLYTMTVRLNSITTVPCSLNPVVLKRTMPTLGRDDDSRFSSTSLRE